MVHVYHVINVYRGESCESTVLPLHVTSVTIKFGSCFGKKICAENHAVLARVIIEDGSFLLSNASVFIKLLEVDDIQNYNMLCHKLVRQCVDSFCCQVVSESDSIRQTYLLDKKAGRARVEKDAEQCLL